MTNSLEAAPTEAARRAIRSYGEHFSSGPNEPGASLAVLTKLGHNEFTAKVHLFVSGAAKLFSVKPVLSGADSVQIHFMPDGEVIAQDWRTVGEDQWRGTFHLLQSLPRPARYEVVGTMLRHWRDALDTDTGRSEQIHLERQSDDCER